MSGSVGQRKRLITITAGNLRHKHIYLTGHHDFFPEDAIGQASQKNGEGVPVELYLDGLKQTVVTDIGREPSSGKPRRFFRKRTWVRQFFEQHSIKEGDVLAIEKTGKRKFRIYPFQSQKNRDRSWREILELPSPTQSPTVIELFAGCGGMALGFKRVGFETVFANEWDEAASQSFAANISPRIANCSIQEIDRFPEADVIAGGPPCQGFSNLGERVPNDPRNQLWRHYMRAVEQARPLVFIMENVPPLLKSQEFVEIIKQAESLGYLVEGRVLNTADYGVPQTRKRAIIIGVRGLNFHPGFPTPTHIEPQKRDLLTAHLTDWVTVNDAIGDLPFQPTGENWHIGRNPTPLSVERYKHIPPGGNRWNLPRELMPECWIKKTKGGTDLFGRLWWDRPSVTIRTEFYKPEKGRYLHPEADRPITHREAARLQTFPDDFEFCGTKIKVGVQIGNAVPPTFAYHLARHVESILAAIKTKQRTA